MNRKILILIIALFPGCLFAQGFLEGGKVTGNFQLDAQYYNKDSLIGAPDVPEKMLLNGFANILYTQGNFSAGVRYESYQNPMLGFDKRYKGSGFAYRFASYTNDQFEITVGNFYEQFGSGLILRSYEERNLGLDNAFDGIRVRYNPFQGVTVKGLIGEQRYFWEKGPGIVRGADAEFQLNDLIGAMEESKTRISLGASMVSKYQATEDIIFGYIDTVGYKYVLPENVAAFAGRIGLNRGNFGLNVEYAHKSKDPNADNSFIYRDGQALLLTTTYSQKGLGIYLSAKRIDNMAFKSKRTEKGNMLNINYLPALTKQHTYSLAAIYPYATQPNGEMALQGEIVYTIPKGKLLGGKYGTEVKLNFSRANSIDKTNLNDTTGYESSFFKPGDELYFQDINVEIAKKFSKKLKATFTYINLIYNQSVIEGHPNEPDVKANIAIADVTWRFTDKKALRTEIQHLWTKEDDKNWVMGLLEYSIAPAWFFSVSDMYNYGNDVKDKQIHYMNIAVGYSRGTNRIQLSYGKQREGIICVGGVCRQVPASNGFSLSITSSF